MRDFIHARDVARGMMLALEKGADCTPINLGSGTGVAIRDVVETLVDIVDDPPEVVWDTTKPDGQPRRCLDTSRAEAEFDFRAGTDFKEGLKRTIDWWAAQGSE